tara:strand:- start:19567 stop:20535 length:969 start_codon:yes stop_codon:yes gene_type:complete
MICKINGFMTDYKIYKVILFYFLIIFSGCESRSSNDNITINRFEHEFYNSNGENLDLLIKKYPYLFPNKYPIETWKSYLKDSTRLSVYKESSKVFKDFKVTGNEILKIFLKLEEIFPEFKKPKVITLNSLSDYESRIIYADSLLLISLDSYLGESYYTDLPAYISLNMNKKYLSNDVAEKIAEKYVKKPNDRTLLGEMIYHGKILYLNKYLTSFNEDYLIFHSSTEKIKWAEENEYNIWAFFIENNFLFNTKNDLKSRFISFSPFSKFNLDIDKSSPGSIGKWIGYKIVDSFMKNNNSDLKDLLNEDYYKIFTKSKYKPKKK